MANTIIQVKKSGVQGQTPSSLDHGELALNYADGILYYKTAQGAIGMLSSSGAAGGGFTFSTINVNSQLIVATSNTDVLSYTSSNGVTLSTNTTSKTIRIDGSVIYNEANSKTYTFVQNVAPTTANSLSSVWRNSDTGVVYENFGNTTNPIWAEVGPTGLAGNTQPGAIAATSLTVADTDILTAIQTAGSYANSAYAKANTASGTDPSAGVYANAAFLQANTGVTNAATADSKAVSAGSYANSAYTQANTATTNALAASTYANAAFTQANTGVTNAATADSKAVTAGSYANSAFTKANTATTDAAGASQYANSAFTKANAAFTYANTAITTSGGSITGSLNVTFTPATTTNTAVKIVAANTKGGAGYADILQITNSSGGATNPTKWIRINSSGELQIINNTYTSQLMVLSDGGDLTALGNVLSSGVKSGYSSGRPGFRVYGATTSSWGTNVNTNGYLNSSQFTVDFNQGSYLNTTTGVFTAPVAGLYQVNLIGRNAGNAGYSQLAVVKNATGGNGGGGTIVVMVEWAGSSTMNHTGGGSTLLLAAGDTLVTKVLAGTIQFDSNDNWSLAYLG